MPESVCRNMNVAGLFKYLGRFRSEGISGITLPAPQVAPSSVCHIMCDVYHRVERPKYVRISTVEICLKNGIEIMCSHFTSR